MIKIFFKPILFLLCLAGYYRSLAGITGDDFVLIFANPTDVQASFKYADQYSSTKSDLITLFNGTKISVIPTKPDEITPSFKTKITGRYLLIRHFINFLDQNDYVFQSGDSVKVFYERGQPQFQVLNRHVLKYDYCFDNLVRKNTSVAAFSPIGKYFGAIHLNARDIRSSASLMEEEKTMTNEQRLARNDRAMDLIRSTLYPEVKLYLKKELKILDSLYQLKQISEPAYQHYLNRNLFNEQIAEMDAGKASITQIKNTLHLPEHSIDSFQNIYRTNYLDAVERSLFVKNAGFHFVNDGTNRDYRQVFFMLDSTTLFPDKDKIFLLSKELRRIHSSYSIPEFLAAFTKFQQKVKDTIVINAIRTEFAIDFNEKRSDVSSVRITDRSGINRTLEEIRQQNKGKVIYLDFWASWCAPCRAAMPASAQLRETLKSSNVVFVYLSIDSRKDAWLKANAQENLDSYEQSYWIMDYKESDFLTKHKLSFIPRYMLFDTDGNLVYANAPRVEAPEIKALLMKLADDR
jgi:thiol-disulfide isomerase/thioredoxin